MTDADNVMKPRFWERKYVYSFRLNTWTWRIDGRTERQTDTARRRRPRLRIAPRGKVDFFAHKSGSNNILDPTRKSERVNWPLNSPPDLVLPHFLETAVNSRTAWMLRRWKSVVVEAGELRQCGNNFISEADCVSCRCCWNDRRRPACYRSYGQHRQLDSPIYTPNTRQRLSQISCYASNSTARCILKMLQ